MLKLAIFATAWETAVLLVAQTGLLKAYEAWEAIILYGVVAPSIVAGMIVFVGWALGGFRQF